MGVIPARDPGPGKAKPGNGESDTHKTKPGNGESDTHKIKPRKGKTVKEKFGAPGKGRHHRSVLGVVSKRT
jgi:hypothetical protein